MRTKEQVDAYVKKTTYSLFNNNSATLSTRSGSFFYSYAPTSPGSNLTYTVDGQPVHCFDLRRLTVNVRIWRVGPYPSIVRTSWANLEIVCQNVRPAPWLRPASWRTFNFPIKDSEHTVIWQQDRPCLSLMRHEGISPPCIEKYADTGLIQILIKGEWKEFHDYIVGHAILS